MHQQFLRQGKRVAIAIVGGAVIIVGVLMAVPLVPGPGLAVMLLGLGILSLEFERPRILLGAIKARGVRFKQWFSRRRSRSEDGQ